MKQNQVNEDTNPTTETDGSPRPAPERCPSHTPEPWTYVETKHGAYVDARGIKIQQHWPGLESPMQIRDNARLIAAAPALLSACKAMQKSLNGSATNFAGMLAAHRQLDAAVALVEINLPERDAETRT